MSSEKFVTVQTEYGPVKGVRKATVLGLDFVNFQGIPYMKAPVGKLRFRDPQRPENWVDDFDATQGCEAFPCTNMMTTKIEGREDAGIINVYTKNVQPNQLFPVMVWIHGGGFQTGASKTDLYGPDYILQKDVILVTLNYRLGALGFLSLDDESLGVPGNAGLKDQNLALKWVQSNIEKFGGDPTNVTLFGESAGGASVHYHMISEQSRGLFKRAIAMSGVALNTPFALQTRRNWAQRLAFQMGYDGSQDEKSILNFLENVDAYKIVELSDKILTSEEKFGEKSVLPFGPQIEPYQSSNCFIPEHPLLMARNAWSHDIDCLIGGTSNEGLIMSFDKTFANVEAMQNSNYFAPVLELGIDLEDPRAVEFGKIIKQTYYGCTTPSKSNLEGYYLFCGDYMFWHGILRTIFGRAATTSARGGKTFVYRYDVVTALNCLKIFSKTEDFPGSEHTSDVFHLFTGNYTSLPSIESKEFENVKKIVTIWTNFAINGSPEYSEIGDNEWTPNESTELPIKCMNIGTDKCEFIELPESERLTVFNAIYKKAGVDLF